MVRSNSVVLRLPPRPRLTTRFVLTFPALCDDALRVLRGQRDLGGSEDMITTDVITEVRTAGAFGRICSGVASRIRSSG